MKKTRYCFLFILLMNSLMYTIKAQGLLISELLANPNGSASPFEYVELIATQSIDFSVTPYAVVFSNNGTANASGWKLFICV